MVRFRAEREVDIAQLSRVNKCAAACADELAFIRDRDTTHILQNRRALLASRRSSHTDAALNCDRIAKIVICRIYNLNDRCSVPPGFN